MSETTSGSCGVGCGVGWWRCPRGLRNSFCIVRSRCHLCIAPARGHRLFYIRGMAKLADAFVPLVSSALLASRRLDAHPAKSGPLRQITQKQMEYWFLRLSGKLPPAQATWQAMVRGGARSIANRPDFHASHDPIAIGLDLICDMNRLDMMHGHAAAAHEVPQAVASSTPVASAPRPPRPGARASSPACPPSPYPPSPYPSITIPSIAPPPTAPAPCSCLHTRSCSA